MSAYAPQDLRTLIQNTLNPIALYSANAEELLMATCAQESLLGEYRQQTFGPALGIFQMEPQDFNDIWNNYLEYHQPLAEQIRAFGTQPQQLVDNDPLAIAMCRVHYLRSPRPLPDATDLNGLWLTYKVVYNSVNGAATQGQFYRNYHTLVNGPAT